MLLILCFWFVFAQETKSWTVNDDSYIDKPGEVKIVTQDLPSADIDEINVVQTMFCNDNQLSKNLSLSIRPWQRKNICVVFSNTSDEPVNVEVWFSEWEINNVWTVVCNKDMQDNTFNNQITKYSTGIVIPASGNVVKLFQYATSKDATGKILWCFGYKINKQFKINTWDMFLIIPRKVGHITIDMSWSIYNYGWRDDVKFAYTDNKQIVLKVLIGILAIWLIATIAKPNKKKSEEKSKKSKK